MNSPMEFFAALNITGSSLQNITPVSEEANYDAGVYLQVNFYTKAFLQPAVLISGILTNAMTFITLWRMPMAPTCKTLMTALCLADFFACVFGLEYVILECLLLDHDDIKLGHLSSSVLTVLIMRYIYPVWLCMSSVIVVLISIIRNYLLQHPLRAVQKFPASRVRKLLCALLGVVLALFSPLPLLILWHACFDDHTTGICVQYLQLLPRVKNIEIYFYVLALIFGPGTTVTNLIFWYKLKTQLNKKTKDSIQMQQRLLHSAEARRQQRRTTRVTKMFVVVLLFNLACMAPFSLQTIAAMAVKGLMMEACVQNSATAILVKTIAGTLLSLLPCTNFWAYLIINKDFEREVKQILCIRCTSRSAVHPGVSVESLQSLHMNSHCHRQEG